MLGCDAGPQRSSIFVAETMRRVTSHHDTETFRKTKPVPPVRRKCKPFLHGSHKRKSTEKSAY